MSFTACKKFRFLWLVVAFSLSACGDQTSTNPVVEKKDTGINIHSKNPYVQIDRSPMDMLYYPINYPFQKLKKEAKSSLPFIRIIYSRPHKKGRIIFGKDTSSLCAYEDKWRLGANEATEIEFFTNVSIAGKNISKGRYTLYCIPYQDKWTIVLNSNLFNWGLEMDEEKDILRTDIPVMQQDPMLEDFTMQFIDMDYGADLLIGWDRVKTILPIEFLK